MSSLNDSSQLLDDNNSYCVPIVEPVDDDDEEEFVEVPLQELFAFQEVNERSEKKPPLLETTKL